MLGDVGWQWRFVLSGLKVASQDLVTILDSRVTGLVGVYVLCLCYGTVFAIVLSLPSCCLVTSTVFFGIIMLSSLSPVSWCLCYGIVVAACCLSYCVFAIISCFIVLSFSSCCFWCRTVFVMCYAVFGIGRAVQGIVLSLSSGWTTSSHLYVAVFVLVASLWLFCPCHHPVFGIALSSVVLCAMVVLFCVPQR